MTNNKQKDYIRNAYKNNSKVQSNYVAPIQYDKQSKLWVEERPNWLGGKTEDIGEAIFNYTFQPLYN